MKRFLILKTGSTFNQLKQQQGDFENWIVAHSSFPVHDFTVLDVTHENFSVSSLNGFKAVIITGSHANVSEHPPWLKKAQQVVAQLRDLQIPMLGICFGHQLIAQTFGGQVDDNPLGEEFGAVEIELLPIAQQNLLFLNLPVKFEAYMSHRQTIIKLPPRAIRLARSTKERTAAFYLEPNIWGVQFHPEFDSIIMEYYLKKYYGIKNEMVTRYLTDSTEAHSIISRFCSYFAGKDD